MSAQDDDFYGPFTLIVTVLVLGSFALFLASRWVSSGMDEALEARDPTYREQVEDRIRPFGQAALPSDEGPSAEPVMPMQPVAAKLSGPQVYNGACLACHGAGIGGAPKFGDAASWASRIAQGMATLNKHALEGYTGEAGYMPPKGGRVDLSDDEVVAAVEYMIAESS